ncbi:DUF4173 domain-containing protein [Aliiroseovarius sp.]|uniref:DUF4153 domain-containing protein n=1 Tax=Aliiroseovarius sp. TaxID=1872442 RepID=UPI003BA9CE4D
MAKEFILRGVPASILNDSWWLGSTPSDASGVTGREEVPPDPGAAVGPLGRAGLGLLGLIIAADLLFWKVNPGLSLAIFAGLIFAVASWLGPRRRSLVGPMAVLGLGLLPVVEHVQTLSVGFLLAGLIAALVLVRLAPGAGRVAFASGVERLIRALPVAGLERLRVVFPHLPALGLAEIGRLSGYVSEGQGGLAQRLRAGLRNWAFPLGGALVLSALLIGANPVLELALIELFAVDVDLVELALRAVFWLGIGLILWPLLNAPEAGEAPTPLPVLSLPGFGLNPGSVLRALITFNALLAVQSVMDLSILVGGASLPEGMSHAEYAHRGAYPLLATAMLAGAFALAARPFLGEHRLLKPLVMLWLGQNVALGLSAMLRLNLYVGEYGLTYLRIHAGIWMGLVVIGLGLTAWQILRARSNGWLMLRAAGLGVATLYACCFVNFAAIIAEENIELAARGQGQTLDYRYLCGLGPMADRAIGEAFLRHPDLASNSLMHTCWRDDLPGSGDPREWGFRSARVRAYLLEAYQGKTPL